MVDTKIRCVLGLQWGDEGKGKLVDSFMQTTDICCRFNGGSNAGHTIVADGKTYALHLLPSGILNKNAENYVGNGVVCHIKTLLAELDQFGEDYMDVLQRLNISDRCVIVLDLHQIVDTIMEGLLSEEAKIGTTKRGIGPAYASKITRRSVRFTDLAQPEVFTQRVKEMYSDYMSHYGETEIGKEAFKDYDVEEEINRHLTEYYPLIKNRIVSNLYLREKMSSGKSILAEGANAVMLDIDHGTYPYVTSSSVISGGVCTGLGIAPSYVGDVVGVVKAYTTRVGCGPFPTELECEVGQALRDVGHEFGATTGRPRRCGWLDLPLLQYSCFLNGVAQINLTKVDVLDQFKELKVCTSYKNKKTGDIMPKGYFPPSTDEIANIEPVYITVPGWNTDISKITSYDELPQACKDYIVLIEKELEVTVNWIGTGPARDALILR